VVKRAATGQFSRVSHSSEDDPSPSVSSSVNYDVSLPRGLIVKTVFHSYVGSGKSSYCFTICVVSLLISLHVLSVSFQYKKS
jgi:hypothetical protein